jgi:trimethylamine--corrinoid protein Co-methyltransferase
MVRDRVTHCPGSWDRRPYTPGTFTVTADAGGERVWDYRAGKHRKCTPRDLVDYPRLVQAMPNIDGAGALVADPDVPHGMRDLICYRNRMIHCDKGGGGGLGRFPGLCWEIGAELYDDVYDLFAAAWGQEEVRDNHQISCFMGAASPLRWGAEVVDTAIHVTGRGQAVGIGGNCISGIHSPITPAANAAVDLAERLSGMCMITAIRPEAEFYFVNHPYMLDMTSGDIGSGSVEQTLLAFLGHQALGHIGFVPAVNHPVMDVGSHCPDSQSAAEKAIYMLLTALGGARGIGGAGQLKEICSYEQLVIDNEIAGYVKQLLKGAEINNQTIGLDDILEHGIGANFLTCDTTLNFLRQCYYQPQLFYRKRMSEWLGEGSKNVYERAHEQVRQILSSQTPVFLENDRIRAMDEVIERARRRICPNSDATAYLTDPPGMA